MKKLHVIQGIKVVALAGGLALLVYSCGNKTAKFSLETVKVGKGAVSNTVTATGTLEALKTVDVGTQVSGVISKLHADFNSHVKRGDLLAELDRTPLLATLSNAQASLDDAKAELTYETSKFERVKALFAKSLVSQSDYDEALYSYSKSMASSKIAQSNYDKAKINLDYATIYSPIDGVVLSREVSEGQTVAANFSAPTLFSIANDLTQMQVEANIDEADIGQVKQNQRVEFTVDAFPDLKFSGKVTEIRLQSTITSNVVTYTVIVEASNPDLKLMPGMTANIVIFVEEVNDVLTLSTKATQLRLDSTTVMEYLQSLSPDDKPDGKEGDSVPPPGGMKPGAIPEQPQLGKNETMVWVKEGSKIRPAVITTGVVDDVNVEVKSGLREGDEVLTGITKGTTATTTASSSKSPFMPSPPKK